MKRLWTRSIRKQLLGWLLAPIMSLWIVSAVITYILAIDFANEAYDDVLLDSARAVSSRLLVYGDDTVVDLPPAALAILKYNEKDEFFYQVLTSEGKLVVGDDSLPLPDRQQLSAKEPVFRDATVNGHAVRVVTIEHARPNKKDFLIVQVAETLQGRGELAENVLLGVVLPQLVLILLAAAAVCIGVSRGLRPLRSVQDALASRSPSDLRPLVADSAPKEVKPLVNEINDLLARLGEDREAQKRFVANAAHQLRTPLAGLKMQAELAERSTDPRELQAALRHIRTSSDRAARLVNQLLTLARLEPSRFATAGHNPIDLAAIAREATTQLVPQALHKGIDLGFECKQVSCFVLGDAESIFELANNLIENAVLYTQAGGRITVKVSAKGETTTLIVEDNGPGIPEEDRDRVFERFYRSLNNRVHGSGLGLAIVREIAMAHGADIIVGQGLDGRGTSIQIAFPGLLCALPGASKEALSLVDAAADRSFAPDTAESAKMADVRNPVELQNVGTSN